MGVLEVSLIKDKILQIIIQIFIPLNLKYKKGILDLGLLAKYRFI